MNDVLGRAILKELQSIRAEIQALREQAASAENQLVSRSVAARKLGIRRERLSGLIA